MAIPRLTTVTLRRALLFLIDIGVPFGAALALGRPGGAALACVSGLLLSFADQDGPLRNRYVILAMVAAGMTAGAIIGATLHGFPWPLWLLFIAGTFASSAFLGIGKAPVLTARFFAMALVVASGGPTPQLAELWFPAAALATAAIARTVDHWLAGPLPHLRGGAARDPHHWKRFAIAYTCAVAASLWIGLMIDPSRALWVVVTAMVVMQPDARASYVRIAERIAGTVLGVVAAFALTSIVHSVWALGAAVLLIAALIPHHLQHRYWLHTALIALLVLLVYDLAETDPLLMHGLFVERLQDMLVGCGFALVGTVVAFPRKAPPQTDD